jgi:hypothetical protein
MAEKIKLQFFRSSNGELNFGDELSPLLVELVSGRQVEHSSVAKCDMISLGSIFEGVYKKLFKRKLRFNTNPIHVWGTGFIDNKEINVNKYNKNFKVHAVRGILTNQKLHGSKIPMGDPGLLSRDLIEAQEKKIKTLIMPHIAHRGYKEIGHLQNTIKGSVVADLTQNPIDILKQISSAEMVISSSLHGLICSDSLGVKNIRLNLGSGLKGGDFKFDDYDTSIGRKIAEFKGVKSEGQINELFEQSDYTYQENIDEVCQELRNNFPQELMK